VEHPSGKDENGQAHIGPCQRKQSQFCATFTIDRTGKNICFRYRAKGRRNDEAPFPLPCINWDSRETDGAWIPCDGKNDH
jgi:hypothetical protein